jgi:hypothetical protein
MTERKRFLLGFLCLLGLAGPSLVFPQVYYSKDEALELAFGAGATVEAETVFLTDEQAERIERLAKIKLDSKLFTFHVGRRQGQVLGYAAIESHNVRTQAETVLVVLDPQGELTRLEYLAFHEPPEYKPPARWLERLYHRSLEGLELNRGVDGIAGATLSSRAVLDGVRKVLAIFNFAVKPEKA